MSLTRRQILRLLAAGAFPLAASTHAALSPRSVVISGGRRVTSSDSPFITAQSLVGGLRNNFGFWIGFSFVANSSFTITQLGRWVVSGNSGTHSLELRNSSGVVIASVSLATSGQPVGFAYAAITPAAITNGNTYTVFSREVDGGDQWYDATTSNSVTAAAVGTITGAAYSGSASGGVTIGLAGSNRSYGPVSFKYTP